MHFVNNWIRPISLSAGALSCPLDLPDGLYRLVIADALGAEVSVFEVIEAAVADGLATLVRGLEGTDARTWGHGASIHCSVTAGVLSALLEQIQGLQQRVEALERRGEEGPVFRRLIDSHANTLTDKDGNVLVIGD